MGDNCRGGVGIEGRQVTPKQRWKRAGNGCSAYSGVSGQEKGVLTAQEVQSLDKIVRA
jgi:hypothetical protein